MRCKIKTTLENIYLFVAIIKPMLAIGKAVCGGAKTQKQYQF